MKKEFYKISEKFSSTPGPRYIKEGKFSAELMLNTGFREMFQNAIKENTIIQVDLDDTSGYATSFLEGLFGQLARDFSPEQVLTHFEYISENKPWYIEEIYEYIEDVKNENKNSKIK